MIISKEEMCAIVAIDSNLHTYLLQAMVPDYDPSADLTGLAPHRKAILRSFFYATQTFLIVPTVHKEYLKITDAGLKEAHQRLHDIHLLDLNPNPDPRQVNERKDYYLKLHNGKNDCTIIAEAEIGGLEFLLTTDDKFYNRIHGRTKTIKLMKATGFWESLHIPRNSRPKIEPLPGNPLFGKSWWRW